MDRDTLDNRAGRDCRRARRLLSDRLDRTLTPEESRRLAEHMAGCPGCAAFERRLAGGLRAIATLPGAPASPAVREAVLREIAGRRGWLGQGLRLGGALAAFALVGLLLIAVLRPGGAGDAPGDSRAGSGSGATPSTTPYAGWSQIPCVTKITESVEPAATASGANGAAIVSVAITVDRGLCPDLAGVTATLAPPVDAGITSATGLLVGRPNVEPLAVEGNGLAIGLPLDADGNATFALAWLNWCGDPGPYVLLLTAGGETHVVNLADPPGCDDAGQPSKLSLAMAPQPGLFPADATPGCDGVQAEPALGVATLTTSGTAYVTIKAAPACGADATFTVRITDDAGNPLDLDGNGASVRLSGDTPYPDGIANLAWTNWCGEPGPFQVMVEGQSSAASAGPVIPPACTAAGQPSQLRLMDASEPLPAPTSDALPACPADQVTYEVESEGAAGTRYVSVLILGPGKTECVVDDKLTFEIQDANGMPLDIEGNGLAVAVNGPEPAALTAWVAWTNWCGAEGPFQAMVKGTSGSTTLALDSPPPCVAAGQPSRLRASSSPNPGPAPTPGGTQPLPPTPTALPALELGARAQGDYTLNLTGGQGLTGGAIAFGVTATVGSNPCRIEGGITVTLRDASGAALDVHGNGVTVPLDAWPAGYAPVVNLAWHNWCGDPAGIIAEVTAPDGTTAKMAVDPVARCQSDGDPSTLVVIR